MPKNVLIGGTGSEPTERTQIGLRGKNMPTLSDAYKALSPVQEVIDRLPPGYTGVYIITPNIAAGTFTAQVKIMLHDTVQGVASRVILEEIIMDYENHLDEIGSEFEALIYEAFNAVEMKSKEWGEYPHIKIWAIKHNLLKGSPQIAAAKSIPGFVFPKWNAAFPNHKALKDYGITEKNGNGARLMPASPKRAVKVTQGVPVRRQPKIPVCPKHEANMVLNTEENIWECRESGCEIIFRPKVDDRPPGTVVLGKGNITFKSDGVNFFLVSDDNVVLDITNYVRSVDVKRGGDYVDVSTFNQQQVFVPGPTSINVEFVNMNIINIKGGL